MTVGLKSKEAEDKLKKFGFNELPSSKPKNFWRIALEVMKEPMFILLICCGVLYMFLGDYKEGMDTVVRLFSSRDARALSLLCLFFLLREVSETCYFYKPSIF